jgi:uncharacterized lipoprotein YmbA
LLKPVESTERQFLLTSLPAPKERKLDTAAPVLGISRIKLPEYLLNSALAVRRGSNEVVYLPDRLWAERLDSGLQRVLAANLGTLLPTSQIRLSSWSSRDVNAELHVAIEQFDLDTNGRGVLVAWWRILSPGGEKALGAGEGRFARQGTAPVSDPAAAVGTLSGLVEDLSRQLAGAVQDAVQVRPAVTR